jgi:hypothetical protein
VATVGVVWMGRRQGGEEVGSGEVCGNDEQDGLQTVRVIVATVGVVWMADVPWPTPAHL